mmetsp:Transcript_13598/g.27095  ORF Transcript_13598/g.27095 Transcript_13598/m.27095 type:complete len:90 (+) Transcript_13598:205-474(+)
MTESRAAGSVQGMIRVGICGPHPDTHGSPLQTTLHSTSKGDQASCVWPAPSESAVPSVLPPPSDQAMDNLKRAMAATLVQVEDCSGDLL